MRPPRLPRALLRALLPRHEIADALEGDLHAGFVLRSRNSPRRAAWWYWRQVLGLPWPSLRRAIARARARESRGRVPMGGGWMVGMGMDLRVALRSLPRRPAFAGVAVMTLALSVGAATLLFSVVNGVLLVPLPYHAPDDLVTVYRTSDEWRESDNALLRRSWDVQTTTLAQVEAWRETSGPVAAVTGYTARSLPLRTGETEEAADAVLLDRDAFTLLGVQPSLGRVPDPEEFRSGAHVAVLRHETWMIRFGGDPGAVGRSFGLGDDSYTVIGVMPPGFFFPTEEGGDLWAPVTELVRTWPSYYTLARLAPGATVEEASAFFERVARRLGEEDPSQAGFGGRAVPHLDNIVGSVKGGIQLLFGTALLVVLVACVNLGNLFLARSAGRRDEMAVRVSLGAGTGSLAGALLAEVAVIGVVGGGLGIALAASAIDPFVQALGASVRGLPRQGSVGLDTAVLAFSLGATLITTWVAALSPVFGTASRGPATAAVSRHRVGTTEATRRGQRLLLSVQAALTVVLVSAAVLLGRSFLETIQVDMGMNTDRIVTLELRADRDRFESREALADAAASLRTQLRTLPGVSSASLTHSLPAQGGVLLVHIRREDASPGSTASVISVAVGEDYFPTMGVPLIAGRGLLASDVSAGGGSAVVSESLAVQLFGRPEVVGRRVRVGSGDDGATLEVVGVVGETRQLSAFQEPAPTFYGSVADRAPFGFYVVLATDGDRAALTERAAAATRAFHPGFEVLRASTMTRILSDGARHIRMRMVLMASLAGLAALLAMIGISGVVAQFLSEQTREVGIRMALGAGARREVGRVVRYALAPTGAGLALGVALAVTSSRVMESFVFGVEPSDPSTYATAAAALLAAAALAAWIPARRTAAIDPARVLNRGG